MFRKITRLMGMCILHERELNLDVFMTKSGLEITCINHLNDSAWSIPYKV